MNTRIEQQLRWLIREVGTDDIMQLCKRAFSLGLEEGYQVAQDDIAEPAPPPIRRMLWSR